MKVNMLPVGTLQQEFEVQAMLSLVLLTIMTGFTMYQVLLLSQKRV